MNLMELFHAGGFVMYPLALFSILIWAIVFERLWFLYTFKKSFTELNQKSIAHLENKKFDELRGLYSNTLDILNSPYMSLIKNLEFEDGSVEMLTRRLQEVHMKLKSGLWILGSITSTAPFIGLFGTVIGIIHSFEDISKSGKSGFSVVAAGLSEALVATAAGIIVAVIAVLFYNFLINKINIINFEFKNRFADLHEIKKRN